MPLRQLFDPESSTYTYLLYDDQSREAALIDPVLEQAERDLTLLGELGLQLRYALDTHVHADHVTALGTLRQRTGCETVLSERSGSGCATRLVKHGDVLQLGGLAIEVRETPGHTSGCLSYVLADHSMAFTGDALLIRGTGRTDFQQGDAAGLYRSIHGQLFSLPDSCLVWPGHDYKGRTVSTIGEEKAFNPRVGGGRSETEFVQIMAGLQLAQPKKIDVAVPANLYCGVPRDIPAVPDALPSRDWAPVEVSAGGIPEVVPEWVAAHLGEFRLVDVREPDEWDGPLPALAAAERVPLAGIAAASSAWPKQAPLVLVCRSGGRSGRAALQLAQLGFEQAVSVRGGMGLWHQMRLS
jgi:glyoxylase-like metal-dependent hydrolase (beta-lactamase superfamily II)/rhodanese-related sulfurtransferase